MDKHLVIIPIRRWAIAAGVMLFAVLAVLSAASPASAAGPNAIMTPSGYNANSVARGDDTSNLVVGLPFTMNWNGTTYDRIYINMNGNCTFGSGFTTYNPTSTLASTRANIMAPFWADVDTRNTSTGQVTYSSTASGSIPQVDGHDAFFVNWINVASYNQQSSPLNSFQLVIVDRSDTGAGNFDFMFNYDQITWDIATSASTRKARVGWGQNGTSYELDGSGTSTYSTSTLLDSSDSATSLIQNSMNSDGQLGRYIFQVRSGGAPNVPPTLTVIDRVLEGNASDSYVGYDSSSDVSASDPDGSIASLTSNLPDPLPLGHTTVTWTATDSSGYSVSAEQSIDVVDTTPPTTPSVTSSTHTTGVWTTNPTVGVDWTPSTDVCSGLAGYAFSWSRNSPETPSTLNDAEQTETTVDSQTFATSSWPSEWTRTSTTYIRLTNTSGRNHGTYAAELWTNNSTRRTYNFYRDYDLSGYSSASLSFWDYVSTLSSTGDYTLVEYSTDGGSTYTTLQELTSASSWTQHTYDLPAGGTVRVRFSGSVNRSSEYADWDDITVTGTAFPRTATETLADGSWYFNVSGVDEAGNFSTAASIGPFKIDRTAPVTSDNAPDDWSDEAVQVTLSTSDPGGVVAATYYRINGGTTRTYTGPISISAEGATSLQYWSVDEAGNVESAKSTTIRIDTVAPTQPGAVGASALSTTSVEASWTASSDTGSGVAFYAVWRDGVQIATTEELSYVDSGLTAGETYVYQIYAVDEAGNLSDPVTYTVTLPTSQLWLSLSTESLDMGALDPNTPAMVVDAVEAVVGGIGDIGYELYCSAEDFTCDTGGSTATMPAGMLSYTTRGHATHDAQPFSNSQSLIHASSGTPSPWQWTYDFDYMMSVPWAFEPGTYTTVLTYTAVAQ